MSGFRVGDRVSRDSYMDDGTWAKRGDSCLPGPPRHGVVVRVYREPAEKGRRMGFAPRWKRLLLYTVQFDNGKTGDYFAHGLDRSSAASAPRNDSPPERGGEGE